MSVSSRAGVTRQLQFRCGGLAAQRGANQDPRHGAGGGNGQERIKRALAGESQRAFGFEGKSPSLVGIESTHGLQGTRESQRFLGSFPDGQVPSEHHIDVSNPRQRIARRPDVLPAYFEVIGRKEAQPQSQVVPERRDAGDPGGVASELSDAAVSPTL